MNIDKCTQMIADPNFKKDYTFFQNCKHKAKELLNIIEANNRRSLLIQFKNKVYTYTWNGFTHQVHCELIINGCRKQEAEFPQYEVIENIGIDLYQKCEWKIF